MKIINIVKELLKKVLPSFIFNWYHFSLAFLGALIYGFPSRKLNVIGVTGTKGKTTTVEMIKEIFEEAEKKTASISSIRFTIGQKEWRNRLKMTMPGRFKLQRFLNQAVKAGCQYAVFEVTSEGIMEHRHRFIDFNSALFTNLSPEHIERHGGFKNYKKAKGKLFKKCKKIHIINKDDKNSSYFLNFPAERKITFSIKEAEILGETRFKFKGEIFDLELKGYFNISNALAALVVAESQGIDLKTSKKALEKIKVIPGRMEFVIKKPFKVLVDYAHTPGSLEKVYKSLKGGNLICVLGSCGGGRDKWRRPKLGEIAQKYCREIILTNEDPYDENPEKIIAEIKEGINTKNVRKILDRRKAIREALEKADRGDIVVITGKGSELWMCIAHGGKIAWDDRKVVKEEYEKYFNI